MKWIRTALFVVPALSLIILAILAKSNRIRSVKKFINERETVLNQWLNTEFVSLSDPSKLDQGLRNIPIKGDNILSDRQKEKLRFAISLGFNAFGEGGESNYLRFRFPNGVSWKWKSDSQIALSNYFKVGTIYAGAHEVLFYKWLRKYGHPDHIEHYLFWRDWIKEKYPTREALDAYRKEFAAKYQTGPLYHPPDDMFSQWKMMCYDMSGDTWYRGLWEKFSPTKSSIVVSNYLTTPPFYDKINFEESVDPRAEGVKSGFANLGIFPLGDYSLIEWDNSIESIIRKDGSAVVADVLVTILQRVPLLPTRVIFRYVYRVDHDLWVPYDVVVCSMPSRPRDMDLWW